MGDSVDTAFTTFAEGYGEDPPASILTTAQREYFFGERDAEGASERALKQRVRRRIETSFWDLWLLVRAYPDEEIKKIYPGSGGKALPTHALAAFLYRFQPKTGLIIEDVKDSGDPTERDRRAAWVESTVSRGIEETIQYREGVKAEVETTITVDRGETLEMLAEGDLSQLSRDELDTLLYTNTITHEEYAEANEQRLKRQFGGE